MEIRGITIPLPPEDCHECVIGYKLIEFFTENVSPSDYADMPSDPTLAATPDDIYPAVVLDSLAHAAKRNRPRQMPKGCAECAVDCALRALRGDVIANA